MKRIISAAMAAVLTLSLAACGSSGDELVSRTPFPQFSEVDTQGNTVTSDIFADYDATIINFWNNGCGTCIAEMPDLEEFLSLIHISLFCTVLIRIIPPIL